GHFTTVKDGLLDPDVKTLLGEPDGTLWCGSPGGLDRWRDGTITSLAVGGPVHAILRDRDGSLWVGAQEGIRRIDPRPDAVGIVTPFGAMTKLDGDGLHRFDVASFLEDAEGNLWAGLETNGLAQIRDGKVTTFGSDFIWTTFIDRHGALWLGADNGLYTLLGETLVLHDPLGGVAVSALAQGPGDSLWIGSGDHGLFAFSDGQPLGDRIGSGTIRALYADSHGEVWFGTAFNAGRLANGVLTTFTQADGVPDVGVRVITEGHDGSMWMGTGVGLLHYTGGKFTPMTAADGLPDAPIEALYADGDDLWVGSYGGGLTLLRGDKVAGRVTSKEGLSNDVVYSIVDDLRGELWMTCNRGVYHAKKGELTEAALGRRPSVTSVALDTSDGMKAAECNGGIPGAARSPDGMLWFPTTAGVVRVDPAHLRKNEVVPPVRVEQMRVNRAPVDLASVEKLPAASHDFELVYTALSFTAPERVRFKYRLEGFDQGWVEAGARRVAYYTNLAPGSYRFQVIAANDDGIWNEKGAEVSFVLLPHFYQTLPFYLACALGLVALGAASVRLRLLALRAQARELAAKVEERTRELATANVQLEGTLNALADKDERLHADLLQAKAFQERILPRLPSGGAIRFRAVYRPADLVGGDVYDVCEVKDGHFRVFLADTTGHGVQASLRTMVLKTEYDRVKLAPEGPAKVLADLNRKLTSVYPDLEMRCSACCFDVIADDEGATLRYANAAHPPLLRVSAKEVTEIGGDGTFLGMAPGVEFKESALRLDPAERIVSYTDGFCEQEDPSGRAFGIERMIDLLRERPRDADDVVRDLDAALTSYAGDRPLADDVVLLCVEFAGERRSMVSVSDMSEYGIRVR
ncbi:MAG TPA: SpoIIE family protein phosphatase, partial [Polyangiaceae bacterium]